MEQIIGRKLKRSETVHHKNGNRAENVAPNLELRTTVHPPGQDIEEMLAWCEDYIRTYRPIQERIRAAQAAEVTNT